MTDDARVGIASIQRSAGHVQVMHVAHVVLGLRQGDGVQHCVRVDGGDGADAEEDDWHVGVVPAVWRHDRHRAKDELERMTMVTRQHVETKFTAGENDLQYPLGLGDNRLGQARRATQQVTETSIALQHQLPILTFW